MGSVTAGKTAHLPLKSLAHRALIVRELKGLQDFLPYTSVHWHMGEKGKLPIDPSWQH